MKKFLEKNTEITYYAIAFGWTWIIVFLLIFTGNAKDLNNPSIIFILCAITSGLAPSLAGILVTRISEGKEGLKRLFGRIKRKSSFNLYIMAFLVLPIVNVLTILISNFTIRSYELNITIPMIILGLVWPLFSSFGEEFGWRGYILPKLLSKYSVIKSGIILGIIWATWHLPMYYIGYRTFGEYMIPAFLIIGYVNLIFQSMIMTNLFVRGKGNLKLTIIYHYMITASSLIIGGFFKTIDSPKYTVFETIISVCLFAIVAVILYWNHEKLNKIKNNV